jgi:hypothetical protein
MKTPSKSIVTIEEKIAAQQNKLSQLKAQKLRLENANKARENKERRAADTRRKILLGAYFLEQIQRDESLNIDVRKQLDKWLTRPDERGLFGFPQESDEQNACP